MSHTTHTHTLHTCSYTTQYTRLIAFTRADARYAYKPMNVHVTYVNESRHIHSSFCALHSSLLMAVACGVATMSRLFKMIGLFCKRAL